MTFDLQNLHITVVLTVTTLVGVLLPRVILGDLTQDHDHYIRHPLQPTFLNTPNNVTFYKGEEAVLKCAIEHKGTRTVIWRRASDPNPITIGAITYISDDRFRVVNQLHSLEWNLHIRDVKPEDSGVYECQVSAVKRNIRQNVMLMVEDKTDLKSVKPEITIHGTLFVERGDTLKLVCNATGSEYPPDAIDWFKDGDKIKIDERVTLTNDVSYTDRTISSLLLIKRCHMGDAGTYVCRTSDNLVTSAKVNILNTGTNNEKRESDDVTGSSHYRSGNNASPRIRPVVLTTLLLTLFSLSRGCLFTT
ncbi:lachesin-like isoform X2 [Physella acuta]|uniref:lachesin-like isoform X2 n=1 Tax=Physella acuta TaxID=109671 RepID=UPI0027DC014B|nr:lachesin-like isoform X2 [Physella acuta]